MKTTVISILLFFYLPLALAEQCIDFQRADRYVLEVQKDVSPDNFFTKDEAQKLLAYANDAFYSSGVHFFRLEQFFAFLKSEDPSYFDDFSLKRIRLNSNGKKYTYIWSYPGDNEFGLWVDQDNNIVGAVSDGDLYIADRWCESLDEEEDFY
jgi:hypothetical protein